MEAAKTKVYGYARVSSDSQDCSLEVQQKRITDYCKFKNLQLVKVFVDENVSGFKKFAERPEGSKLNALLTKDVRAVVCIRPDRLFRNTIDALTTVNEWNEKGIELHVIDIGGATLTTNTASGKIIFTILIAFAQFERDVTGERTSAVLNHKKSNKQVYSSPVFGFDAVDGKMLRNEEEMKIVDLIKRKHADKVSLGAIANLLNVKEVPTKKLGKWHSSTIKNIIENPIYVQKL